MSEPGPRRSSAVEWVRVLGWQIIGLIGVVLLGLSVLMLSWACADEARAKAALAEDCGKITGFITDCLPEASKPKLKQLIEDAVELGADMGLRELERERGYMQDRSYGRRSFYKDEKKAAPSYYGTKRAATKPAY